MKSPSLLRLTLRDMFLLVALAGIGLGWYREYRLNAPLREAIDKFNFSPGSGQQAAYGYGSYKGTRLLVVVASDRYWRESLDPLLYPPVTGRPKP